MSTDSNEWSLMNDINSQMARKWMESNVAPRPNYGAEIISFSSDGAITRKPMQYEKIYSEHTHQFNIGYEMKYAGFNVFAEVVAKCSCGLKLDKSEIETRLNSIENEEDSSESYCADEDE